MLFLFHQPCLQGSRTRLNSAHHKPILMHARVRGCVEALVPSAYRPCGRRIACDL